MPEMSQTGALGYFLAQISSWGHLGVVLFNILSGFVLSLPYLGSSKIPPPRYIQFLQRRFLRILPNYWVTLIFWTLVLLVSSNSLASVIRPFLAHLLFLHSFFPEFFFSIVPAYWWLGLLAQFYLAFPILLRLFRRFGSLRCLVLTSLLCWAGWLALYAAASREPQGALAGLNYMLYFNLPARLPEFAAGMWLASAGFGGPKRGETIPNLSDRSTSFPGRSLLMACLILGLSGFLVDRNQLPLYHPYLSIWCFLLVAWVLGSPRAASVGRLPLVAGLARISYSIYLIHQPVLAYGALLMEKMGLGSGYWPLFLAGSASVTAALSMALEAFLRRALPRISRRLG